jgi:hypothetical protein
MGAPTTAPSIAAFVGVKDEVEIIAASIAHLRHIGVDHIIVSDAGSTDGTLDVLAAERRAGDLVVTHQDPGEIVDYATESDRAVALARESGADWVVFMDADEFWIPATGSLKDCRHLHDADVILADRFNVVVTPRHLLMPTSLTPRTYDRLRLFTRQVDDFRTYLEHHPQTPFVTVRPGPKVMARPSVTAAIAPGGHDVGSRGTAVRRVTATDLIVAHVPFSTPDRFVRKVANIRQELQHHPGYFAGRCAWHWRRWAEMTAPGAIDAEFARQISDDRALAGWCRDGLVRSAAELLAERAPAPVAEYDAAFGSRLRTELLGWYDRLRHPSDASLWPVDAISHHTTRA